MTFPLVQRMCQPCDALEIRVSVEDTSPNKNRKGAFSNQDCRPNLAVLSQLQRASLRVLSKEGE